MLAAAILAMHGCGGGATAPGDPQTPEASLPVQIDSVTFEMAPQANGARPAKIALVQFITPSLGERLAEITPGDWFGTKGEQFQTAHPNAYYDDWEIVPGQITGPFEVTVDEYVSAVLFCETQGTESALRVNVEGDLAIHVERTGCEIHSIE